jgi:integrase/recombinase XerC
VRETRRLAEACDRSKAIGVRDHAILQLALGAGLRRSEISACDLGWLQLHQSSGTLRVQGKGAKERAIGIPEPVVRSLREWLALRADIVAGGFEADSQAVFVNLPAHVRGKRLAIRSVNTTLERLAKLAKLPVSGHVHKLRATFATEVYKATKDIKRVQYLLGHSDINTTEAYIALAESELKAGMPTDVINHLTGGTTDEQKLPAWYKHRQQ